MVETVAISTWVTNVVQGWYYVFVPVVVITFFMVWKIYKKIKQIDHRTAYIANYITAYIEQTGIKPEQFFPKKD